MRQAHGLTLDNNETACGTASGEQKREDPHICVPSGTLELHVCIKTKFQKLPERKTGDLQRNKKDCYRILILKTGSRKHLSSMFSMLRKKITSLEFNAQTNYHSHKWQNNDRGRHA